LDSKLNSAITVFTYDMNINLIGIQKKKNNNKYLNLFSESQFISFVNVYTRLPKGFNNAYLDHINGNDHLMIKINSGDQLI
jgi:hypothetical protein